METASGKETIIVLRRLIAYSEKIFQLSKDIVTLVSDRREKPRISTAAVVKSSLVLFWARMGSSNAWEQVGRARFWHGWLGEPTFSAEHAGTRPCSARCQQAAARDSRRLPTPETE